MIKKSALTLLAALALAAGAHAQMLVGFDVSGTGATGQSPTVDPSVTATGLSRTTVAAVVTNNAFNSNTWNTGALNFATNYISFDVTAGAAPVTFSTLQYAINGSNTAPNQGEWAYFLTGTSTTTPADTQTPFTLANATPSLSTWDFNDFTLGANATAEFRFYAYGATAINSVNASAATGTVRIANITGNDLIVNGPASVPEPSTLAVFAAAITLMGTVVFRRFRTA